MSKRIRIVQKIDKSLNRILCIILALVLAFGVYSLWDTWMIMHGNVNGSDLTHYKPNPNEATHQSLEELMLRNPDVCAWLTINNTGIDYPVLQGKDNFEYLTLNTFKKYSMIGSLFLDYQCDPSFNGYYSLIHGHHMTDSIMFGDLSNFETQSYFNSHTSGYLMTAKKTYVLEIFACLHSTSIDAYIYTTYHTSEASNRALLEHINDNALCKRDIGIKSTDKILAMSTCANGKTSDRTVLFAKMTERKA